MAIGILVGQSLVFASSYMVTYWPFFFLYGVGFGINNGIAVSVFKI
jgi:hypothetical protein